MAMKGSEQQKRSEIPASNSRSFALSAYGLDANAESAQRELAILIGEEMLRKVLATDAAPMVLKAVDLLDETDRVNGERTWLWGYWKFQVSESVLMGKLAPAMRGAPGYRGHLYSGDHRDPVIRTLWFGIDTQTDKLSAIVHVLPTQEELRTAIRNSAAFGNLEREFRLSLAPRDLKFDEKDSNRIVDFGDAQSKKEISLDLVRFTGTRGARIKSPIMLSSEELEDNAGSGGRKMRYEFDSLKALVEDADVKEYLDGQVQRRLGSLSGEEQGKVLASLPVELVLAHAAVKPLAERKTRDEVLKSLSAEELKGALGDVGLAQSAREHLAAMETQKAEIQGKVLARLETDLQLSKEDATRVMLLYGDEIVLAADPLAAAVAKAKAFQLAMGNGAVGGDARGKTGGESAPAEGLVGDALKAGRERLNKFHGRA